MLGPGEIIKCSDVLLRWGTEMPFSTVAFVVLLALTLGVIAR